MLGDKIRAHGPAVWLINTGWTAGPHGEGHRIAIPHTRAMVTAALGGRVDLSSSKPHPLFRVAVPRAVPGVPEAILDPRATWKDGAAYDRRAAELARMFQENFKRYADHVSDEVKAAAPRI